MNKNCVGEDDLWKGIIAASEFSILYNFHPINKKSDVHLLLGRDTIVPIEHVANWKLIYQRKQTLIDKNTDKENSTRINHHFQVDDQVLIRNNQANKYETPYNRLYTIIQTRTNGTATLRMGATTDRINTCCLKPCYT